jgi:hypothetical protein
LRAFLLDAFIVVIILVLNYSTVIGYFTTNTSSPESSSKENVDEILVSFNLVVKSSNLTKSSHYNTYQNKLYRLIKFLKEERGIGYRRISHILTEKGYRSVRTNSILKNNYIHSIYKKGKVREDRINRKFKTVVKDIMIYEPL